MTATTSQEKWSSYVDGLTWVKHHLDDSSWSAFLRAGSLKIPAEDALREVAARIEMAGDNPKPGKLQRQVRRAYEHAGAHAGEFRSLDTARSIKSVYEASKLAKVAGNLNFDVDVQMAGEALASFDIAPIACWVPEAAL